MRKTYLIAGLGNPGIEYEGTRHNIGFHIVQELAKKYQAFSFKKKKKALFTAFLREDKSVFLILPQTYMNLSGEALKKWVKELSLPKENLLVIMDDAEIPFGKIRCRSSGSSGGHNGLKSIEESLHTQNYARLKCGIGRPDSGDLAEFVLEKFTEKEKEHIPEITQKALEVIEKWLTEGVVFAMNLANK